MSESQSNSGGSGSTGGPGSASAEAVADFLKDDAPIKDDKSDKGDKTDKDKKNTDIKLIEPDDDTDKLDLDEDDDKDSKKDKKDKKDKVKATRRGDSDDDDVDEDDEDDKEGDEDDEDEDLDIDDEDEIEIDAPPRKKDVTAKYPKFFKEYPWFEKMMYRDRQYTELFGSFDDAKESHRHAQILTELEGELGNGNTERLLNDVKTHNKKAFDKLVDNYLPTLAKVDKEAYLEVTGNIAKSIIRELHLEGKNNDDEELQKAAFILNKFVFGTTTYTAPKPRVIEDKDNKDDEVAREREELVKERYETSRDDLQVRVDNTLRSTIENYIDSKGEMTAYVKKNAVKDALTNLHTAIGNDTGFRRTLDKLWQGSFSDKFSRGSLDRIKSAYLGRAKAILPVIIRKARAEALKDLRPSSRKQDEDEQEDNTSPRRERRERREPITSGRPRQSGGKMKMEKGESVLDFLSRD
jgi:hypothetical protein